MTNHNNAKNILGTKLEPCCFDPKTGFFRDGSCNTNHQDYGKHLVCAILTDEFLKFSKNQGNDLITPMPQYNFPGLKAGDKWCLCVSRFKEAIEADVAPKIMPKSTHEECLKEIDLETLKKYFA